MSANSLNPHSCSVCGAEGHGARRCSELAPPPDGFWKGQRMPDDEGDDCRRIRCAKKRALLLKIWTKLQKKSTSTYHRKRTLMTNVRPMNIRPLGILNERYLSLQNG